MGALKELYEKEQYNRQKATGFLTLIRRKGEAVDMLPHFRCLPDGNAAPLLDVWRRFHHAAHHKAYADFYDKILYCSELCEGLLDESTFLELIADRSFLFLNYSECGTDPEYPTLSRLVESYDTCLENYRRENVDKVWGQGFVPTDANYSDYLAFQHNLSELNAAIALRKTFLDDPEGKASLPEGFCLEIKPAREALSNTELSLSSLFEHYLDACKNQAYVRWEPLRSGPTEPSPWNAAIHAVWEYTSRTCGYQDPPIRALVFFHLFTQKAQKLYNGTLRQYKFEKIRERTTLTENPDSTQLRIQNRIRCNIQLYDQLLELFIGQSCLPFPTKEARTRYYCSAKFQFYRYSRYDRYWHYDLSSFWDSGYNPCFGFHYLENYRDGVDNLGNLLRHHIHYCLPNQAQWLIPVLHHDRREPPLSVLTTFLLAESTLNLQPNKRLVHKVQKLLDSKDGAMLVKEYTQCCTNQTRTLELLTEACRKYQLIIPHEELVLYESLGSDTTVQKCSQYVLEYFLRERMIRKARARLGSLAKTYFDQLCLNSFSYNGN